ncbi:MAG: 3-hydroxyanthranilate 3,4-dioxygenase [Crocinitomicaceae bacterium]|nr:3-hydroxyanthranilate 3,4-dioxygenase [Crocinitomicaceae bacterium]
MKAPFNLQKWIDENRDLLKPPVSNKNLYAEAGDFIVMIVGGPNARKDYHYNESEELFYQIEGDVQVKLQINGEAKLYDIKEGEMFLLPGGIPHSPIRPANTVGLVVERVRKGTDMMDGLMWFCDECNHQLKEYKFKLTDIENDFQTRFRDFYNSEENRTCDNCGHVMETDPRFTA